MAQSIRGFATSLGVAAAGFLIWLSTQFGAGIGNYWIKIGLLAAAGLALPLSQLLGGWTKWGWPRFSYHVLIVGFIPALVLAGWVILSGQPEANWFQRHVTSWSGDLHVARLVRHLRETYLDVLAFGLGSVFGFSFDTTGPRVPRTVEEQPRPLPPEDTAVTRVEEPDAAPTQVAEPAAEPTEVAGPPAETAETWVTPSGDTPPAA
jgi:hypothetical protein